MQTYKVTFASIFAKTTKRTVEIRAKNTGMAKKILEQTEPYPIIVYAIIKVMPPKKTSFWGVLWNWLKYGI